jgi:hypothetical protein
MLSCGHDPAPAYGRPLCAHARAATGSGVETIRYPFESEDGASHAQLCVRDYYWDHAMVWLDEERFAVGGLGDDDESIHPGARIFDSQGSEIFAFAGPGDRFFSAYGLLYAVGESGLEIWDPATGARLGSVPGFRPTIHHRAAQELAALDGDRLVRWRIVDPRS